MKPKTKKPDPVLAGQHIAKAQTLEKNGDLPSALGQYKLALTVDPENAQAIGNRARLIQVLAKRADERYNLGMKYHREGKYGLARKEFLIALKYNPDHKKALKMVHSLKSNKKSKYVSHTVQPGESLSQIAIKYYGDYRKYKVIARFNHLDDNATVKPGQRIMIPDDAHVTMPAPPTRSDKRSKDDNTSFVWHMIQRDETIAKLAQLYYGDFKLFHAIAQYNGMVDATRVSVGQKIKIPKLAGVPFHPPAESSKPEPPVASIEPAQPEPLVLEPSKPEPVMESETETEAEPYSKTESDSPNNGEEQIRAYREAGITLFNEGKYEDAIFELNKAVEAMPGDESTRLYLAKAYFEHGKHLFNQDDLNAAQESFESSLQYNPLCDECRKYIDRIKMEPILAHRRKGFMFLQQKQYDAAINELIQFWQKRPEDKEIRKEISMVYCEKGKAEKNKNDFKSAIKDFKTALDFYPDCENCNRYIIESITIFKESHYNRGLIFIDKQQLPEAITELKQVYEMDPEYKDVEQHLKKAQELWEKLEQIKKKANDSTER